MRKSPDVLAPAMPNLNADDATTELRKSWLLSGLVDRAKLKSLGARSGPANLLDVFLCGDIRKVRKFRLYLVGISNGYKTRRQEECMLPTPV
jgi:hypothetical protein